MTAELDPEAYLWEVTASTTNRTGQYNSFANLARHVVALSAR